MKNRTPHAPRCIRDLHRVRRLASGLQQQQPAAASSQQQAERQQQPRAAASSPEASRRTRCSSRYGPTPGTGRVRNSSGRARHQFHSGALILLFLKKAQLVSCLILHCTRFCSGAEATAAVTAPAPSILLPPAVCAAGCCSLFFFTGASPDAQALMPLRCTVLSTVAQALCELQCK